MSATESPFLRVAILFLTGLLFLWPACGDDEGGGGDGGGTTGEFCDNEIDDDGDGATDCDDSDCASFAGCQPVCGDGEVEGEEECDDGDENSDETPDACRTDCTSPSCGDGVTDDEEACDDGDSNSDTTPNACRAGCSLPACGDEIIDDDYDEDCDDGDDNADDTPNACREDCSSPACGDAIVDDDYDEECDEGDDNSDDTPNTCRETCLFPLCGDAIVDDDFDEECDDGGTDTGDGCTSVCTICEDDSAEDEGGDDSPDHAVAIEWPRGDFHDRVAQPGDADWYLITPPCDDASVVMEATFLPVGGEVTLRAYAAADSADPMAESEPAVGLAELTVTSTDPFYLAVESVSLGVCSTYDLAVAINCALECEDDDDEENDTPETAAEAQFMMSFILTLEDQWALDWDYFYGTLPALCDLELDFLAFQPDQLSFSLEVDEIGTFSPEGDGALLYTNATDNDVDWMIRVAPDDFDAAAACIGYAVIGFKDCECYNLLFNDDTESAALLPTIGGTLPQQRINNVDLGAYYELDLCDGGTVSVTTTVTAGGDSLGVKILESEGETLAEGTHEAAVTFTNDGGEAFPVWVEITTEDECTYFDLEITADPCVCVDDELESDDLPELKNELGEDDGAYATAVFVDGEENGDLDYWGVPLCARGSLDAQVYWLPELGDLSFSGTLDTGEELNDESWGGGNVGLWYDNPAREETSATVVVEALNEGLCTPYEIVTDNYCPELDCDNNNDDDGDGDEDCDDHDCIVDPACVELICDDGLDNDDDGDTNCDDLDCAITTACGGTCPQTDLENALGDAVATATLGDTATNQARGSCGGEGGPDVNFSWTVPDTAVFRIDTIGSDYDTVLYLRDGCQGVELACNDDLPWSMTGAESSVTVSLDKDDVVYIFIDTYDEDLEGDYVLNITMLEP